MHTQAATQSVIPARACPQGHSSPQMQAFLAAWGTPQFDEPAAKKVAELATLANTGCNVRCCDGPCTLLKTLGNA